MAEEAGLEEKELQALEENLQEEAGKEQEKEPEKEPPKEPEPDPLLEKASQMGWRPKEEFEGDPDAWVDAGEFIRRKPLFDEIHKNKREVKAMRETLAKFKVHHEQVQEAARKQAIEDLKAEKLKALEVADHERVIQIDDEIAEKRATPPPVQEANPEFDAWVENNSWYESDRVLRHAANVAGKEFFTANPDATKEEIYEYAEAVVKEKFPGKFKPKEQPREPAKNENRSKPSAVSNSTIQQRSSGSDWDKLSDEAKMIGMEFVRDGILTKEQYAKDILLIEKNSK